MMSIERPKIYKNVRRYDIAGHSHFLTFSCYRRFPLLVNQDWCALLAAGIKDACAKHAISLWAYVFMPEHVHLLIRPRVDTYSISDFLRMAKQPVATKILNRLKKEHSTLLERLRAGGKPARITHSFWQAGGGYDFNIWSMEKAVEKARYCHRNPVTRGLVDDPGDWLWSSYQWLEMGVTRDAPLELDPWDEFLAGM